MTTAEWESLCDGCGRCCLHKLRAEDTREVFYTDFGCPVLDTASGKCSDYPNRMTYNVGCFHLTPALVSELDWMPPTCGYRRVNEGRDLEWWHPLVSGDPATVDQAGISIVGRAIPRAKAGSHEYHTIDWPNQVPPSERRSAWIGAMFGGVNASIPTPFGADRGVALDLMAQHCFWLLSNGCHGLAVLDKAGEVVSLAIDERLAILDGLVARGVPASKLLTGIGPASAADAARIAARAEQLGVRGVLLSVAAQGKVQPHQILSAHVRALIKAIPESLHLYLSLAVSPQATAACLTALEAFMAQAPGRLRGIRDEAAGCAVGLAALERFRERRFEVYTADEAALATLTDHGGAGLIGPGANLLGRHCTEIMRRTRPEQAPAIQRAIEAAGRALRPGAMAADIKALLARHSGNPDWERVRLPLRLPGPNERAALFRAFDASGVRLQPVA
jgi:uncharacterized cysteine cluster protein YcgN (CxxCxxCC family)/dihydrodipicolinate synthase/N-acetylneuraminate lyase